MIVAYVRSCIYCGDDFVDENGDRDGDLRLCDSCYEKHERCDSGDIDDDDDFDGDEDL
jgi:hypothetical protein